MMHLTCGHSAGGTVKTHLAARAPDDVVLVFADALSCGPAERVTLASEDLARWFGLRAEYWQRIHGDAPERSPQLQTIQRLQACSAVTLWLGTGANDQLLLCWLADVLMQSNQRPNLLLIQIEQLVFPKGRAPVPALGMVHPDQLTQAPAAKAVKQDELTDLASGWQAWCATSPRQLLSYLQTEGPAVHARRAIATLLARYPLVGFGVNQWELAILRAIERRQAGKALASKALAGKAEASVVQAIGSVMGEMLDDCLDIVGDGWLYWRMRRMAGTNLSQPLLTLDKQTPIMRGRTASLTKAGRAVIAGDVDAISLNGIHDRIGGVALSSEGQANWRYEKGALLNISNPVVRKSAKQ